jgi:hypothetical protein
MNADEHRYKGNWSPVGSGRAFALRWKAVMTTRREQKPESSRSPPAIGNSSPQVFLAFVGLVPAEDLIAMENDISESCERMERKQLR